MNDPSLKALANALVIFKLQTLFTFPGMMMSFSLLVMDLKWGLSSFTRASSYPPYHRPNFADF